MQCYLSHYTCSNDFSKKCLFLSYFLLVGDAGYLELVTEWILQLSECTIHYIGISLLCEIKGCAYILKKLPNLANKLLSEMDNLSKVYTVSNATMIVRICHCFISYTRFRFYNLC